MPKRFLRLKTIIVYFNYFIQNSTMLILTSNNFTMSTIRSDLVFRRIFNDLALTFLSKTKNIFIVFDIICKNLI